jgi:hypothetical protein
VRKVAQQRLGPLSARVAECEDGHAPRSVPIKIPPEVPVRMAGQATGPRHRSQPPCPRRRAAPGTAPTRFTN